ncbi:MAG: formamidopyrimidine-DNA glycosylase [Acidimicrobiia bacterium]|nr:formamidopyrimidine-DNA glycosylase [Acidimicrobiia bacterium]
MPELPEVEAVCRKLRPAEGLLIRGVTIRRCASPNVRRAKGRKLEQVERRGKHLLLRLSGGKTLHVHLRMSGNLFLLPSAPAPSDARALFRLDGAASIVLEDPRALARMELVDTSTLDLQLSRLGPEPLEPAFTKQWLVTQAKRSRLPAKLFLMDQSKIAGLGNIYAAEVLFRSRINPRKPIKTLTTIRLSRLHAAIVGVLDDAVQSACIAYSGPGGFLDSETFPLAVYGREGQPCLYCRRSIRRLSQGGRSTYFCPGCQR